VITSCIFILTSAARSVGYYLSNPHSRIECFSECDHG